MRWSALEVLQGSQKEQWHLLDSFELLIHVIDLNAHQIVYTNRYSKNILGDVAGKTCWQVFPVSQQGPCPFCPREKLLDNDGNPKGPWVWEMQNSLNGRWYELMDKAISWGDGRLVKLQIARDITKRKRGEDVLRQNCKDLAHQLADHAEKLRKARALLVKKDEEHRKMLAQLKQQGIEFDTANIALQVLLEKFGQQENELEERIVSNIKHLIFPYLDNLERHLPEKEYAVYFSLLKENLVKLSSSFTKKLSTELLELTPREIQVADLVKEGRSNKEIATLLNLSTGTVECFRDRMRKKLGIKNKKVNLRSFLISKCK